MLSLWSFELGIASLENYNNKIILKTVCGLKFQKKMYTSGKNFFVQILSGSEKST